MIGVLQATEAIKLLTGLGDPLAGKLLLYDALNMTFRPLQVKRHADCALCGNAPTIRDARVIDGTCDLTDSAVWTIDAAGYRKLRAAGEPHILLDVREAEEIEAGHIEGHIHIPLGDLANRVSELDGRQNDLIVCLCKAGIRSRQAAAVLHRNGFQRIANLEGGYLAWLRGEFCQKLNEK
jgi:adenylyltransferase/sulfurtransferase